MLLNYIPSKYRNDFSYKNPANDNSWPTLADTHTQHTYVCDYSNRPAPGSAQGDGPHTDKVANQEQMLTIIIHFWGGAEQRDELKFI